MSVSPRPQPTHPFLRRAACSTIGLGCLLMAGTVLSSVVQAPTQPPAGTDAEQPFMVQSVCGYPVSPGTGGRGAQPLVAVIRLRHMFMRITNSSPRPWYNVAVSSENGPSPKTALCTLLLPHQTRDVVVPRAALATRFRDFRQYSLRFSWECRTGHRRDKWCGYLVR